MSNLGVGKDFLYQGTILCEKFSCLENNLSAIQTLSGTDPIN